jgi:hypothetical protein
MEAGRRADNEIAAQLLAEHFDSDSESGGRETDGVTEVEYAAEADEPGEVTQPAHQQGGHRPERRRGDAAAENLRLAIERDRDDKLPQADRDEHYGGFGQGHGQLTRHCGVRHREPVQDVVELHHIERVRQRLQYEREREPAGQQKQDSPAGAINRAVQFREVFTNCIHVFSPVLFQKK